MRASNIAAVGGRPGLDSSKRRPLMIYGTRQQPASVGVLPQQQADGSEPSATRWRLLTSGWRLNTICPPCAQCWNQANRARVTSFRSVKPATTGLSTRRLLIGPVSQAIGCASATRTRNDEEDRK